MDLGFSSVRGQKAMRYSVQACRVCVSKKKTECEKKKSSFLRNPSATFNPLFNKYICSILESFTLQSRLIRALGLNKQLLR